MENELFKSKEFTFTTRQLFEESELYYDWFLPEWESADNANDFVGKIFNGDLKVKEPQLYWELSKQYNPDNRHWYRVREIFPHSVIKTSSDSGSILVGNKDCKVQIRNGYGDGTVRIAKFGREMLFKLEQRMIAHDIVLNGAFNVYFDDSDMNDSENRVVMKLDGRYRAFYYSGLVAFVDLDNKSPEENLPELRLEVESVNDTPSNERIINDYSLSDDSLEELKEFLGDTEDDAEILFMENCEEKNKNVVVEKSYNETIQRDDFRVLYHSDLVWIVNGKKVVATIDSEFTEMYDNEEVIKEYGCRI